MEKKLDFERLIQSNKSQIEFIQWGIIAGVASLIYPEYIKNMKSKTIPTPVILLPKISFVRNALTEIGDWLCRSFREEIMSNGYYMKYKDIPEFSLLKMDEFDIILEKYILPNILTTIPNVISAKFDLNNPNQQSMREDRSIDLFGNIKDYHYKYLIESIMLNLSLAAPSIPKGDRGVVRKYNNTLMDGDILTIKNDTSICPIHINKCIINNPFISTITSVTCTFILPTEDSELNYVIEPFQHNLSIMTHIDIGGEL